MYRPTRRRVLHAVGLPAAGLLAGCAGDERRQSKTPKTNGSGRSTDSWTPGADAETVHLLTDYVSGGWETRWSEELVPAVAAELGLTLETDFLGLSIPHEKRQQVEDLRENGTPPEALTSTLWSQDVGYFLANGWLDPVTETVETAAEALGPVVGEPATVGGEHYVVPHGSQTFTIHYRTDVLDELGLDPPHSIETLVHNARVIDEETDLWGFALPSAAAFARPFVKLLVNAHGGHLWRWADEAQTEAEVWFPEAPARDAIATIQALAATSWDWGVSDAPGPAHFEYAEGNAAQYFFVNAAGAELAAEVGNDAILDATDVLPVPATADGIPWARGRPGFDGYLAFGGTDGRPAVDDVLEFLYRDPTRVGGYYGGFPTLYLPAWRDVLESDQYRTLPRFRRHPHLLDLVDDLVADVLPLAATSDEVVLTPATAAAERGGIFVGLLRDVLVEDQPVAPTIRDARSRFAAALEESQRRWTDRS